MSRKSSQNSLKVGSSVFLDRQAFWTPEDGIVQKATSSSNGNKGHSS
jgi:hypothetical protein